MVCSLSGGPGVVGVQPLPASGLSLECWVSHRPRHLGALLVGWSNGGASNGCSTYLTGLQVVAVLVRADVCTRSTGLCCHGLHMHTWQPALCLGGCLQGWWGMRHEAAQARRELTLEICIGVHAAVQAERGTAGSMAYWWVMVNFWLAHKVHRHPPVGAARCRVALPMRLTCMGTACFIGHPWGQRGRGSMQAWLDSVCEQHCWVLQTLSKPGTQRE